MDEKKRLQNCAFFITLDLYVRCTLILTTIPLKEELQNG